MSVSEREWQDACRLLGGHREATLVCHVAPDGDALGSMLALGAALRATGMHVTASWGSEPFEVPRNYQFLPALDLLTPADQVPRAPDLLITLDTGSVDRLGSLADRVAAAGSVLVLDHHVSNTRYGTVHLVDPQAAATAVVVAELLERLGLTLTEEVAVPLYTGVVTDTGSFRHASASPSVHELTARLLATGIRPEVINREIWDTQPFGYVQLLGDVCARARLDQGAARGLGLVWTTVDPPDLARHRLGLAEVEGVIDVLRTTAEAEVALVVKADPTDGLLKVSTRSKGAIDVGAICTRLGGGGHRFAAGYTSDADLATTVARLRAALDAAPHLAV